MQANVSSLGESETLVLERGRVLPPDELAERLSALGYERADVVEHRGEFAVRGGIVDVFPGTARRPIRAEFFGDEIELLREFSAATQLSTDPVARAELYPVRELLPTEEVRRRAEELLPKHKGRVAEGLARLADGLTFEGMETFGPLLFEELNTPAELLPRGSWVALVPGRRIR